MTEKLLFPEWCIKQHQNTNHLYDGYLPYEFHLRMVVTVAKEFLSIIPDESKVVVIQACWGHDLIEDCRISYNDIWSCCLLRISSILYHNRFRYHINYIIFFTTIKKTI